MTSTPKKSAADSRPVFEINDTVIAQGIEDQEFSPEQQDPKHLMAYKERESCGSSLIERSATS